MPVEGTGHVQRGDNTVVLLFPPQPLVQPVSRFFYLALALSHLSIGEPGSFVLPARIQSARSKGKVRVHKDHIPARLRLQGKRSCSRLSSFNFRSPLNYLLPLFLSLSVSWSVPYAIFFFFSAPSNVHPFFEQPESNVCFLALSESAWKWEEHRMKHTRWYILCVPKRAGVGVVCMRKREREREKGVEGGITRAMRRIPGSLQTTEARRITRHTHSWRKSVRSFTSIFTTRWTLSRCAIRVSKYQAKLS